jgi:hypothetical protein
LPLLPAASRTFLYPAKIFTPPADSFLPPVTDTLSHPQPLLSPIHGADSPQKTSQEIGYQATGQGGAIREAVEGANGEDEAGGLN